MNTKFILILLIIMLTFGMWNCEDVPATGVGPGAGTARIQGYVSDLNTSIAIQNASVYLTMPGQTDSVLTTAEGRFQFEVDLSKVTNPAATVTVRKAGYELKSVNFTVSVDTLFDVGLKIDLSTSAVVYGVLRDSATLYPLRNGTVLLTLPGVVDSAVTITDGAFRLVADLVDRESIPVTITAFKNGFKTKRIPIVVHKGQSTNLGDVLLSVDAGSTVAQMMGRIFDAQSKLPVNNATVTMITNILTDSVKTSVAGDYSFSIDLQGLPSIFITLKLVKTGYKPQSLQFNVGAGKSVSNDFFMVRDTTTGVQDSSGTGLAHSIAFVSMTAKEISVYGVGGMESSILVWEVRDSLGFPIDIDHRDTVEFQLSGTPLGGGAYVSPARAITNVSGRVATTVNSGTVSGVLQFTASLHRESDGVTIASAPVIITVNAGLPDQTHLSIAPVKINFPAYDWLGRIDPVTVQVGDKYSNPVKTNTAVYFNTTGGIINASGFTDKNGQAVVDLHSGNPRPFDPLLGTGFARIAAMTMGENNVYVTDTIVVLFSATAEISLLSADTFSVPSRGRSAPIFYRVSDRFLHPLAEGTQITVHLQYVAPPNSQINLVVTGDIDVTLGDTQSSGRGTTDFYFQVADQTEGGVQSPIPVTAVIKVTSPNGNPPPTNVSGVIGG